MPNRIIKESICTSPTLADLTAPSECLFYRLITMADDFGRFDARLSIIKARCFPLRLDRVTDSNIEDWLSELVTVGLLKLYTVDGIVYGQFVTWDHHQRVRNKLSKIPAPNGNSDDINPFYLARFIPTHVRISIFQRDHYKCLKCGTKESIGNPLSIDHINPVANGGTSDPGNLQTLCMRCNLIKNTKTIDYRQITVSRSDPQQIAAIGSPNPNPESESEIESETESLSEKKNIKEKKYEVKAGVFLTSEETTKLIDQFGETGANERIEKLSLYLLSTGKKYKSHYYTILNWERMAKPETKGNGHKPDNDKFIKGKFGHMVQR
jgi:hypothetical protein